MKMRVELSSGMQAGDTMRVATPAGIMLTVIPEGASRYGHFFIMVPQTPSAQV